MMPITTQLIRKSLMKNRVYSSCARLYSTQFNSSQSSPSKSSQSGDVAGLSSKVLKVPSEPIGPGASKTADYKNPEYFSYHSSSYFDAELEMLKFRLPQPSSKSK